MFAKKIAIALLLALESIGNWVANGPHAVAIASLAIYLEESK